MNKYTLAQAVTANGAQAPVLMPPGSKTFQASMTVASGSGSVTVGIEGSLDGVAWDEVGSLSPTDTASDSITMVGPAYLFMRAHLTDIAGTGAAVTVYGGA